MKETGGIRYNSSSSKGDGLAFHSLSFLFLFLPAAWLLHGSLRRQARLPLGIALGLVFLAWTGLLPLQWVVLVAAWVTLWAWTLRRVKAPMPRRLVLGTAVAGLISALVAAKYLMPGLMAVGLSFLIFFAVSALVDIHRRPDSFAFSSVWAYLSFFPKFLTGPLLPYRSFKEQSRPDTYDWSLVRPGFGRLTLGLFKKLWIADPLGKAADRIFDPAVVCGAGVRWLGLLAFALQIYMDFSAYTDMAVGLGRLFGIQLGENFNFPYLARSLRDFWRRWHISLGLWFRDYLFLPLAYALERRFQRIRLPLGMRSDRLAAGFSLWLTMVLCGAWHGQGVNFWLWGLYFGTLMQFESPRRRRRGLWCLLRTQSLILLGWILFRTATPKQFLDFLLGLWPQKMSGLQDFSLPLLMDGRLLWAFSAALLFGFPFFPRLWKRWKAGAPLWTSLLVKLQPLVWLPAWLLILTALSGASHRPFIYLKF